MEAPMPKAAGYLPHTGPIVTRAEALAAGKKRYFTGKPCPRGHVAERYASKGNCAACLRLQPKNLEAARAYSRAYHAAKAAKRPPRILTPKIAGSLTFDQVNDYVVYDQTTGLFTWRKTRGRFRAGEPAGYVNPDGYVVINLFFRPRRAHRLAWLLFYGEWPPGDIDHINRDRADNRLANLRVASREQNTWNSLAHRDNGSGFKGVTYVGYRNKPWQARIYFKGKGKTLGYFATAKEAHACYIESADRLFGEFSPHGSEKGRRRPDYKRSS
jgi:hypothetical protein